jgi:FkbM family methyltransferase
MNQALNSLVNESLFAESAAGAALRQKPLGFVDVGARGGVHGLVEPIAGVTAVLAFEPDEEECARLRSHLALNSPWAVCDLEACALAQGDGEAMLHLLSAPTNHSLRPPNLEMVQRYNMVKWHQVGSFPLQTTSLDKVLFERRLKEDYWGEFLKLDTQGTEFEILKGSQRTLSERTVAIFTEVAFCQLYDGQKLFSDVEMLLRECGFSFYGFATVHQRSRKQLDKRKQIGQERTIWADAVFFKDPLPGGSKQISISERGNYVLFTCALLLGYYDFALELALETWAVGEEAKRIEKLVRQCAALSSEQSYSDALALAERVREYPELANIEVGRFVDRRRQWCDYDDVSFL